MAGKLFVVCAPSGAGKTSLVAALLGSVGQQLGLSHVITYTSRTPRLGEASGIDYHFIAAQEFEAKAQKGFFLEWSGAYGNYYGSPRSILQDLERGASYIMILDRAGVNEVRKLTIGAVCIWIEVPSVEILRERLMGRGTDSLEQVERRLILAKQEIAQERENRLCRHHILNDSFETAVEKIKDIIYQELGATKIIKSIEKGLL